MMRAFTMVLTMILSNCASPPETPEMRFLRDLDRLARTPMSEMRQAVEAWLGVPLETHPTRTAIAGGRVATPVFSGSISVDTSFPPPASPGAQFVPGVLSFSIDSPCITPDGVRAVFGRRGRLVAFPNLSPRAYDVPEGAFGYLANRAQKRVIIFGFAGQRCADAIGLSEGDTVYFDEVVQALAESRQEP